MPFVYSRIVNYAETDMAGIVHFAHFFRYLEEAEHAYLRSIGLSVHQEREPGCILSWPRVACSFDFREPLFFEDAFEVHLFVERMGGRSVTYRGDVYRGATLIATGHTTAVCCEIPAGGGMRSVGIPPDIRARIEPSVLPPADG